MKRGFTKYSIITGLLFWFFLAVSVPQGVRAEEEQIRIWSGERAAGFAGGDGSEENPYQISNGEELAYFGYVVDQACRQTMIFTDENGNETESEYMNEAYAMYRDAYYVLTADIYLNDTTSYREWNANPPANRWGRYFMDEDMTVTFDGNGHTVYGLYGRSFLGTMGKGTIQNLNIKQYYVEDIAVLCANVYGTTFRNCTISYGTLYCDDYSCAGIAYRAENATFEKCVHKGSVKNKSWGNAAGFIGEAENCVFKQCENTGAITSFGTGYVSASGIAVNAGGCEFIECINSGKITSVKGSATGIVSSGEHVKLTNCTNNGTISCSAGIAAGISLNLINAEFIKCKNSGKVTSVKGTTAGIAAEGHGSTFTDCVNTGTITNKTKIEEGGMIGASTAGIIGSAASISKEQTVWIEGCINTGNIVGNDSNAAGIINGLVGAGYVYNCQNHGTVSCNGEAAGIVARLYGNGGVNGVIYNAEYVIGNCSNTAAIKGAKAGGIGGWIAWPTSKIDNCYNKGKVTATEKGQAGAIVQSANKALTNCYYQKGTASYDVAPEANYNMAKGTAKWHSASYMKSQAFVNKLNKIAKQHEEYNLWTRKNGKLNTYPYIKGSVIVPNSTK
ncbi:MAG: hypothetical protein IJY09_03365 [Lachnospiraceae bacterium]|nr:hypothetical protein [Lachnospiraceae bacterium]